MVEYLPTVFEALGSTPRSYKKTLYFIVYVKKFPRSSLCVFLKVGKDP